MILRKPVPHKEAAAFIRGKPVVSRQVFKDLLPELKGRAFTVAGIEYAGVAQEIRDRLADLPEGALWDDVKGDIAADLVPYMVDPDTDKDAQDKQAQAAFRRAELLLRIHGFQAYNSANWQVMDRQREVLPYWQYHSMEDARVRPSHAALDGLILPADSPFWRDHFPPWEWGCRCLVTPIPEEDARRIQGEDKDRNPEERRFMDGAALRKLEEEGALIRNAGAFNVTSGHAKGDKGAFYWDPATLRMPPEELKKRYDPAVWAGFEKIARATPLQNGKKKTVWDWLNEV
jgi:SPP1 gp7 family putative phage head morphogenesis protein